MKNSTGSTVATISVSYTGEQWRNSAAAAQTVSFLYQIGTTVTSADPSTGTWTPVTSLDFTSPITGGTAGALDGNNSANRVAVSASFSVSLADGDEIMLLWSDLNHPLSDHGLAIDDFSVSFSDTPVPVELVSFRAQLLDADVRLMWKTATELNNFGFVIERRADGASSWEDVGFVAGHGTRFTPAEYSFRDTPPAEAEGMSYRLRQIDRDGSIEHSDAVRVMLRPGAASPRLTVFPNPATASSVVSFVLSSSTNATVSIHDLTGRRLLTLAEGVFDGGTHTVSIPSQSLRSGTYLLLLEHGGTRRHSLLHVTR